MSCSMPSMRCSPHEHRCPRFRVLVADAISLDGLAPLRDDPRFELVNKPGLKGEDLTNAIADADAVLVRSATRITRESLSRATKLKAIGRAGVGVDTIDVDAATEKGIPVLTAPEGNTISAAELTMALLLALARKVPGADRSMKAGEWDKKSFTGTELHGKTLGSIGAGRIGGEVARRARGFQMRVLVHDPFLNAERARSLDVETATMDEVIERADVISAHVPLTDATRNLIGEGADRADEEGRPDPQRCPRRGGRRSGAAGGAEIRACGRRGARRVRDGAASCGSRVPHPA